ncbi:MAG: glycosyltransferase [Candidatus Neomarinimicrobiota bacterium]
MKKYENKVIIITHSYPYDGMEFKGLFIKDQAGWLSKRISVEVIAPRPRTFFFLKYFKSKWEKISRIPYSTIIDNINVIRPKYILPPKRILYPYVGWLFSRTVLRSVPSQPKAFHVHFVYPDGVVIPALKRKYPTSKVVLSVHGSDWYVNIQHNYLYKPIKKILTYADSIVVVSEKLKSDIIEKFSFTKDKLVVIPNALDINTISDSNDISYPEIWENRKNSPRILVVASYVKVKGIDILLKALSEIQEDYELLIVGGIIDETYYNTLTSLKTELHLDKKVSFLAQQSREILNTYYKSCDFFVLPSRTEGFGIVLIEAMSFGKPVVSTKSGGPEDIVEDYNGILADANDSVSLRLAILEMLNKYHRYDPELIRKTVYDKFGSENITDKIIEQYN